MKKIALLLAIPGLAIATVGLHGFDEREAVAAYKNPLAIQQSGYGMTLARLSQDMINTIWHMGQEHDHEDTADLEIVQGLDLTELPDAHVHGPDCNHPSHEGEENHDHSGHDHEHGENCDHPSHDVVKPAASLPIVKSGMEFIRSLESSHFDRTNKYGANDALKLHVAKEVESRFLRAYRMDPTNYGVYNGYFLFLTIHDLGGTPETRAHARKISDLTFSAAFREKTAPSPWLTAAAAVLNQFFLDNEDAQSRGEALSAEKLLEYDNKIGYCIQEYQVRRSKAVKSGRWNQISQERRTDMEMRAQFAMKTKAQFGAMIARMDESDGQVPNFVEKRRGNTATATTDTGEVK